MGARCCPSHHLLWPPNNSSCHLQLLGHSDLVVEIDGLGQELVGILTVPETKREAEAPTGGEDASAPLLGYRHVAGPSR